VSPLAFALITVIVTLGATLQGTVGFGMGLLAVPMLILIDPRLVPGPLLGTSVVYVLLLAVRNRRGVRWGDLKWALTGRFVGVAIAAAVLAIVSPEHIELIFGVLILLAVALSASGLKLEPKPGTLVGAGTLSGFMATTVSIGGPPMALLYQHKSGERLRGTMSGFFVVGILLSITALHLVGRFGRQEAILAAMLLPGTLLGFLLSQHTARVFDRGYIRPAVLTVSSITALVVLVRQLF
jgi:uncharacterized membrane protein YfcA